ncbi:MAG TPA: FG-GAP-like repeat-containing protein, partial [Fimbriiglobus sp.]|nr:FG-GAP-like repeat-containing protein [Fimbriiglobus sp.]
GVFITSGDLDGDGFAEVIAGGGPGGGPRIFALSGQGLIGGTQTQLANFFAGDTASRGGIRPAAKDLDGDGFAEVIAGGGPGGGPRVFALSGQDLLSGTQTQRANFFAGDTESRGGVRLAVKDLDGDTRADLVTGAGTGAGSRVTAYAGSAIPVDGTPPTLLGFDAFPEFTGGVFVG